MKRNRRIPALDPYRKPAPSGGPFAALNWPQQRTAEQLLWEWCQKWGTNLPPWRLAILVARARRLALHPLGSAWGKSLRCRRGGLAAQEWYKRVGIVPTGNATAARRSKLLTNPPPQPPRRARSTVCRRA
jgi:hypothetical protein